MPNWIQLSRRCARTCRGRLRRDVESPVEALLRPDKPIGLTNRDLMTTDLMTTMNPDPQRRAGQRQVTHGAKALACESRAYFGFNGRGAFPRFEGHD